VCKSLKEIYVKKAILALAVCFALAGTVRAGNDGDDDRDHHDHDRFEFQPGTLVLTRSVYVGTPDLLVPNVTVLPPGCVAGNVNVPLITPAGSTVSVAVACATPTNDGTYPTVFNNAAADGHFGITSPIFLDDLTTDGHRIGTLPIPTDQIVTSFSSKSELAIHVSTDHKSVTFMGYRGGPGFPTGANIFDVSNGNTPGLIDPTNAAVGQYYRSVAEVDAHGHLMITEGNAYSGDNGRGAYKGSDGLYYMVGNDNSGNLSKKQVTTTIVGEELVNDTGVELLIPGQTPPVPPNITKIGDFEITQVTDPLTGQPYAADKAGKDNNYRGLTIFHNTVYVSKGSGGNGINTVYQVGTPGVLPTGDVATLAAVPITILPGFPITLAAGADPTTNAPTPVMYPFGLFFADDHTLYVGDEGDDCSANGSAPCTDILAAGTPDQIAASIYAHAANQTTAGLQKWILDDTTGQWNLAYTIQMGLNLGVPQTIAGYPAGINGGPTGTNLPWAPATDGLRNLAGRVNDDGTVTIWAVTSTVSGGGDQGADPNQLVKVTDRLCATTLSTGDGDGDRDDRLDQFVTIRAAKSGEVYRGVTFAPQDRDDDHHHDHDDWN
jgi:hypothetical protein